jgi:hypothetical protein
VGGQLLGHGLGQHGHAGLAHAVVGVLGHEPVVQRGDEQDRAGGPRLPLGGALPLGDQGLHQPVGEQPRPPEVRPEHEVELRGPDLQEPVGRGDADVVDHQLDRAVPGQLVGHADHVLAVQVGLDDLAGLGAEGLLELVRVLVDHGDLGPGHDQPLGDRLANAAGGAGDDGSPASEVLEELVDRRQLLCLTGIVVTVRLHAQLTSPPGRCVPPSKSVVGDGAVT